MGAGVFSKLYVQYVFSIGDNRYPIYLNWEKELYQYISEIIAKQGQKLISINGMPNHVHIFVQLQHSCSIADLVEEIKITSTNFINTRFYSKGQFRWQMGYAVFSYSHSSIPAVVKYIVNQKEYHNSFSFENEYVELLNRSEIDYDENYLFDMEF